VPKVQPSNGDDRTCPGGVWRYIYTFWRRVYEVLSLPPNPPPSPSSVLTLNVRHRSHERKSESSYTLAVACGLWVVHRARIRLLFSQTPSSPHSLLAEWQAMVREIVAAKRKTAAEKGTLTGFLNTWSRLITAVGLL
jgi:hypothetical protein